MFDLSKAMDKWRRALSEKRMCSRGDVDELESHLRDEMDQLQKLGLSEQEAFMVGAHRLGEPAALAGEFAKVNKSLWLRTKVFYAGCGLFAYLTTAALSEALSKAFLLIVISLGLRGTVAGYLGLAFHIILFALFIILWLLIAKRFDVGGEQFSRTATGIKGKMALLTIAFLLTVALAVAKLFIPVALTMRLGAVEYGQILMAANYIHLFWVIGPIVLMSILIYLRPSRPLPAAQAY